METITPRKLSNRINREMATVKAQKNQKPVKSMAINIEWVKSKMYGSNPHATVDVCFQDGSWISLNFTCSGCGYDKQSTVIADAFNAVLLYKLHESGHIFLTSINGEKVTFPYGVRYYNGTDQKPNENGYISKPYYEGGVGTNCYYDISKFIGGKLEHIASGKSFDSYKYTDGLSS